MSMFRILLTLRSVGYDGGLQVDHLPGLTADTPFRGIASAYSVAYIRGLLAALEATEAPPASRAGRRGYTRPARRAKEAGRCGRRSRAWRRRWPGGGPPCGR